jgi:hypothetical protein
MIRQGPSAVGWSQREQPATMQYLIRATIGLSVCISMGNEAIQTVGS